MTATLNDEVADLRRINAELQRRLDEALEEQTATAEVLGAINSSPGDLAPVFGSILEKALSLCGAAFGGMFTYDGERFPVAALCGVPPELAELYREPMRASPGSAMDRLVRGASTIQVADITDDDLYRSGSRYRRALADIGGARTMIWIPLRKEEKLFGCIGIYRREVRPFSDKQIALLESFAAQAVIAMENARLITETREALEQQTATAEVLQVINASPGDLAPVFDAILEKAHSLCGADHGHLTIYDGNLFRAVASHNVPEAFDRRLRQPFRPGHDFAERLLAGERVIHLTDMAALTPRPDDEIGRGGDEAGIRTLLFVPLRKDGALLGYITAHREEVRPFSDKQIALLENFAAQAVIAMENARLITETREALARQTATAEVLQVINSSPGDLAPVFDTMLEKAMRLCEAAFGFMMAYDGERFRPTAQKGVPEPLAAYFSRGPDMPGPGEAHTRILAGETVIHSLDYMDEKPYRQGNPLRRAVVDLGGARTALVIALRRDHKLLGTFTIYRQEVRPFSEKHIALLENFAAQAVIAMENVRLITETREALEQQTATTEVLQVINSSPGELAPVFDAMLDKAMRLCEAAHGHLYIYSGDHFTAAAIRGDPSLVDWLQRAGPVRPRTGGSGPLGRIIGGDDIVHLPDALAEEYIANPVFREQAPGFSEQAEVGGFRTLVTVALRKEDRLLGAITVYRKLVRPFSDKQIALLQNFAAQAVIAMENARLITETREALEQQTATAEVLGVINSSPGDLAPVFESILEKAHSRCDVEYGSLHIADGDAFRAVAVRGMPEAFAAAIRQPVRHGPNHPVRELVAGASYTMLSDGAERDDPIIQSAVKLTGMRTVLWVPLRKDDALLGYIVASRKEDRPFSDKQVALLQNFAAQAVIAIENARLLAEIRQRQAELRVTFDNMGDGVAMFDSERRLAAWNRNFQELLDLPDMVLAERPSYADYLRLLAARGEFGEDDIEAELSRRLEHADQELRLERTRPDGRVIEVRRNSVPDGGFVLIYSDITERKRSEAEIRAARDAAEATLRDLRAAQANLIQAEKMASLGQLTAGIAHEIKNPLNFVNNFAGLSVELLDELKEATASAVASLGEDKRAEVGETMEMLTGNLEKIAEHGRRADNIVKSMLEHSRGVSGERREVDLNGLVEEALNLAYHGARARDQSFNITMEREFDRNIRPIEVAPQEITRVFLNLFGNGFYAANTRAHANGGASFRPTLTVSTRDLGEAVEVKVRDNGTGIPLEIKDKLFQPFFTTKPTGEGTGLGLSISYDIVTQQHGGAITVESAVGEFTEFTVRLPRTYRATTGEAASSV